MPTSILQRIPQLFNQNRQVNQTQVLSNQAVTNLQNSANGFQPKHLMLYRLKSNLTIGTGPTLLTFDSPQNDQESLYFNGVFNVPEDGFYYVNSTILTSGVMTSIGNALEYQVYQNGDPKNGVIINGISGSTQLTYSASVICTLMCLAGDTLGMYASNTPATTTTSNFSLNWFQVYRFADLNYVP